VSTGIARRLSPEEEELANKQHELALLQVQLADKELFLANLKAELTAFEGRYLKQVGVLYSELDEWNARLAELIAERKGTEEARAAASQARVLAAESCSAFQTEPAEAKEFAWSPELKSFYREIAKRIHPDLATDDADRAQRERLMAEANSAYQKGDAEDLRRILQEYESSPEAVRGTGVASDLVRVLRQLNQVKNRLAQIEEGIARFAESDIANLRNKWEEASRDGRDLFAEMAANVQGAIDAVKGRYDVEATRM